MKGLVLIAVFFYTCNTFAQIADTTIETQINIGSNLPLLFIVEKAPWRNYFYLFQIGLKTKKAKHYSLRSSLNFSFYKYGNNYKIYSGILNYGIERPFSKRPKILIPYFGVDIVAIYWREFYKYQAFFVDEHVKGLGVAPAIGLEFCVSKKVSLTSEISTVFWYAKRVELRSSGKNHQSSGFGIAFYRFLSLTFNYKFLK